MSRYDDPENLTIRETLDLVAMDDLKPLLALLGDPGKGRKTELVERLAAFLEDAEKVRGHYEDLDSLAKKAVQEAVHNPEGRWNESQFHAKYGKLPKMGGSGRRRNHEPPARFRLFFPRSQMLPTDLRTTLLKFVPAPPPLESVSLEALPETVRRPHVYLGAYHAAPDEEKVDLRIRETEQAALLNAQAVLRLAEAGSIRVSDKTHRPSEAGVAAVLDVLADGDFYSKEDRPEDKYSGCPDLAIQAFAWPLLLQAAGLAEPASGRLRLTKAGRNAASGPAHETIRRCWEKWLSSTILDEFNRIEAIRGQQSQGGVMTALAPRRQAVVDALKKCAVGKWLAVEELFRLLKVLAPQFAVTHSEWQLYIGDRQYGSLGYEASHDWETLQGRYVLAFLFEHAATLGIVDVGYISPVHARNDFADRWGTDDMSCLSRYDGLMFFRITSLGARCLGLAEEYVPQVLTAQTNLKVLPNLDVVSHGPPLNRADTLMLDRFATKRSESVWRLDSSKILQAAERGTSVEELKQFLADRSDVPLPETVEVFLSDIQAKEHQLKDLGMVRMIACTDPMVARLLVNDRKLRKHCQLAGERNLVFDAANENAVRRGLRELGYVLPVAD